MRAWAEALINPLRSGVHGSRVSCLSRTAWTRPKKGASHHPVSFFAPSCISCTQSVVGTSPLPLLQTVLYSHEVFFGSALRKGWTDTRTPLLTGFGHLLVTVCSTPRRRTGKPFIFGRDGRIVPPFDPLSDLFHCFIIFIPLLQLGNTVRSYRRYTDTHTYHIRSHTYTLTHIYTTQPQPHTYTYTPRDTERDTTTPNPPVF